MCISSEAIPACWSTYRWEKSVHVQWGNNKASQNNWTDMTTYNKNWTSALPKVRRLPDADSWDVKTNCYKLFLFCTTPVCTWAHIYMLMCTVWAHKTLFCRSICCRAFSLFCAVLRSPDSSVFRLSTWDREREIWHWGTGTGWCKV